jgi:hypothetical protein
VNERIGFPIVPEAWAHLHSIGMINDEGAILDWGGYLAWYASPESDPWRSPFGVGGSLTIIPDDDGAE